MVRVSDETWEAAKAAAEKDGTTVSAVVRRLLAAYAKAGAVLLAVLAVLTLGACGAAEPATSPAAVRSPVVATSAAQTPSETVSEADCYSAEDTAALEDMWIALPHAEAPVAVRIAALEKMLAAIPADSELCDDSDLVDVQSIRESALMNLAELRSAS